MVRFTFLAATILAISAGGNAMLSRTLGFALAFTVFVAFACAVTQSPNDDPLIMQASLAGSDFFTVTRVDPDGTILLGPNSACRWCNLG
jgi:hypothetical protein